MQQDRLRGKSLLVSAAAMFALQWGSTSSFAMPPIRLTLDAAVERAVQVNADLLADAQQVAIAEAALRRSLARFPSNPYLSLGASRRAETGGRPNVFVFLSQEVEIAGQRASRVRAAQHNAQQEGWNLAQKRVSLVAEVKSAFIRALSRERRTHIIRQQIDLARKLLAVTTVERATLSERIERNNAALQLARFERELWGAQEELDSEIDTLRRLLQIDFEQQVELSGNMSENVRVLPGPTILAEHAKTQRPDIQAFRQALAAAEAQIEVHRRERIPNLTLSASYSRFDSSDFGGGDVGISLPLFQTKEADIQESLAQRERIALQLRDLERGVEREVREAYRSYLTAAQELRLFQDQLLPLSEENSRLQQRLVQRDEASRSEWLTQQLDALDVRKDFVETLEKLNLAFVGLERALGGQFPDDGVSSDPPSTPQPEREPN